MSLEETENVIFLKEKSSEKIFTVQLFVDFFFTQKNSKKDYESAIVFVIRETLILGKMKSNNSRRHVIADKNCNTQNHFPVGEPVQTSVLPETKRN